MENCAISDVTQFNLSVIRKVSFFEFGSKLQIFFSITCLSEFRRRVETEIKVVAVIFLIINTTTSSFKLIK